MLSWFSGKSLENAKLALDLLAQSEALGYWIPNASRKVRAAMSKQNVAAKYAGKHLNAMEYFGINISDQRWEEGSPAEFGREIRSAFSYGNIYRIQDLDFDAARKTARNDLEKEIVENGRRFAADFAEVAALITRLDATRPKPVFTSIGVSPTLTATLTDLGVGGASLDTIRPCPMEHVLVEKTNPKTGKKYFEYETRLVWPENTVHGASRYDQTRNNMQCQACGHAIKNAFNWVPLLVDVAGVPHSLWVGRDCCKSLFGIEMKGELDIVRK